MSASLFSSPDGWATLIDKHKAFEMAKAGIAGGKRHELPMAVRARDLQALKLSHDASARNALKQAKLYSQQDEMAKGGQLAAFKQVVYRQIVTVTKLQRLELWQLCADEPAKVLVVEPRSPHLQCSEMLTTATKADCCRSRFDRNRLNRRDGGPKRPNVDTRPTLPNVEVRPRELVRQLNKRRRRSDDRSQHRIAIEAPIVFVVVLTAIGLTMTPQSPQTLPRRCAKEAPHDVSRRLAKASVIKRDRVDEAAPPLDV